MFVVDVGTIDLILALIALEAVGLILWRVATGRGPQPAPMVANLAAGGFLLLALREALDRASPIWIMCALAAALASHLVDLSARWTRRASDPSPQLRIPRATISLRASQRQSPPAPDAPNPESRHA